MINAAQPSCAIMPITKYDIGLGDLSSKGGKMKEIYGSLSEFESDLVLVT